MNTIHLENITLTLPTTWDELTAKQMRWIASHYLPVLPHIIQPCSEAEDAKPEIVSNELYNELHIFLLFTLTGLTWKQFTKIPDLDIDMMLNVEEVHRFILDESGPLRNPFPTLGKLQGPADNFSDLTADEFFCANAFIEATSTQEFLAVLYRPVEKGKRIPFDLSRVEMDAQRPEIAKCPPDILIILGLWFEANLIKLRDDNPNAFEGKGSSEGDFLTLMLQVAKDGPFGTFPEVKSTNIHLLMAELDRVTVEAREMRSKS
jgi:hypothetical protein